MLSPGANWEAVGQIAMAIGALALLCYLAPGALPIPPHWVRWLEFATFALIGAGLFLALAASAVWFLS